MKVEMKKIILLIVIFLVSISNGRAQEKKMELEYQNDNLIQTIGIGLVQLVKVEQDITLYEDSAFQKVKLKKAKIGRNIIPLLNKPDYGILFFICVEKKTKYYKIATSKNTFAYIKPSENFMFYNWDQFLKKEVTNIESKNLKENPPRIGINDKKIDTKNWSTDDETEVVKVQENWLQIKNITRNKIFWIEWRNQYELKVYLNLLI